MSEGNMDGNLLKDLEFVCSSIDPQGAGALLERTLANHASPEKALCFLLDLQMDKIRKSLAPGRKTVGIFHTNAVYRDHFGDLNVKLKERGFNVLIVVDILWGPASPHGFEGEDNVFFGGRGFARRLDFVDAFFAIDFRDYAELLPDKAVKVGLLHNNKFDNHYDRDFKEDFLKLDSGAAVRRYLHSCAARAPEFDYIVCPTKKLIGSTSPDDLEMFRGFVPKGMTRTGFFGFIPAGYPKFDRLIKYFEGHKSASKTIMFSIGLKENEWSAINRCAAEIIGGVLEEFPDYTLMFRPHPREIKDPDVLALAARFKDNPRFVCDDNPFYMENYSKAALMISDQSTTPITYQMATMRPVIFCRFVGRGDEKLRDVAEKKGIGFLARSFPQLAATMRHVLAPGADFSGEARRLRDMNLSNPGCSTEYLADNMDVIISGGGMDGWLSLPIGSASVRPGSPEEAAGCASKLLAMSADAPDEIKGHWLSFADRILFAASEKAPGSLRLGLASAKLSAARNGGRLGLGAALTIILRHLILALARF